MYLSFFGGLRASEVCRVSVYDFPHAIHDGTMIKLDIRDKVIRADLKSADINQSKKNRKQPIFIVPEMFESIYQNHVERYGYESVCINKDGKPMTTASYQKAFNKVKKTLINRMMKSDDPADKAQAMYLDMHDWSTHIGRGYFTNLIAEHATTPFSVSVYRGDSDFSAAAAYIMNSQSTSEDIIRSLEHMYKLLGDK